MGRLYGALLTEEHLAIRKAEFEREKLEKERVKKLVVNGDMEPPPELIHLYFHPVFRVNAMLRRLAIHNDSLYAVPKVDSPIAECEPFEYNSQKYFEHLHRTGKRDWLPAEVRRSRRAMRREKAEKAREERLAQHDKERRESGEVKLLYR